MRSRWRGEPEHAEPERGEPERGEPGPRGEGGHMVMEVGAPGTDLAAQMAQRGPHRRAAGVLENNGYPGGAGLSGRLTALARLVQIGSARGAYSRSRWYCRFCPSCL